MTRKSCAAGMRNAILRNHRGTLWPGHLAMHSPKFQLLKCRPKKFVSKFKHRCRHFEQYSATMARQRFRDVIPSERWHPKRLLTNILDYGCFWAILFWAKHVPNSEMISEVENRLKKNGFCWPCEGRQVSFRYFSFPPISSRMEWRHINTAWLPRQFQNGGLQSRSFKTNLFRIAGTSEAETSVSGKAGKDLKKLPFWHVWKWICHVYISLQLKLSDETQRACVLRKPCFFRGLINVTNIL